MTANKRAIGSNLAKVDATTNEDIARQIAEDPDTAPELTQEWFDGADQYRDGKLIKRGRGRPKLDQPKKQIAIRLDADLIAALRGSGPGWSGRVNDALRQEFRYLLKPKRKRH